MGKETTSLDLALSQAKRVNRESRILIQMLARLREAEPTAPEAQGAHHASTEDRSSLEEG